MSGKATSVSEKSMSNQNQKMDIEFEDGQSKGFLNIRSEPGPCNSTGQTDERSYYPNANNETMISEKPHSPGNKDYQEPNSERKKERVLSLKSNKEELQNLFENLISQPQDKQEEKISEITRFTGHIFTNTETEIPEFSHCLLSRFLMFQISAHSRLYQKVKDQNKPVSPKNPRQGLIRLCNILTICLDCEFRKNPDSNEEKPMMIKNAYFQGDEVDNVLQNTFRIDMKKAINYFLRRKNLIMTVLDKAVVEKFLEELNSMTQTEFRRETAKKIRRALIDSRFEKPDDRLEFFLREISTIDCSQNASNLHENLLELKRFLNIFLKECEKKKPGLKKCNLQTYKRQLRRLILYVEDRIARLKIPIIQFTEPSIVSPLKWIA